jgi:hypothetical protein
MIFPFDALVPEAAVAEGAGAAVNTLADAVGTTIEASVGAASESLASIVGIAPETPSVRLMGTLLV